MTEPKQTPSTAVAEPYTPTPADERALQTYADRKTKRLPARIKITETETGQSTTPDHPDLHIGTLALANAMGTASPEFMSGLLGQITNAVSKGLQPDESAINFALAVANGIGPRDEVEAMLATQMACVHMATLRYARHLAHVETLQQQEAAERGLTKLSRTFTAQMDALKRYRSTGQQTVRVERVTVEAGGQAIVGPVSTSGGGSKDGN